MPKLTKKTVDLAHADGTDYFIWDDVLTGFGLRISPAGTKSYFCQYRSQNGCQRRYRIGRHGALTPDQARAAAQKIMALVQLGKDPGQKRTEERAALLFQSAYSDFLRDHVVKLKSKTAKEYERCGQVHLIPAFGKLKVKDLERQHVTALHREMRDIPYQANRVLAILSKFFNWCELQEIRRDNSNPCRHIKRYPEHKRERYLSSKEFARLGEAIQELETSGCISSDAANAFCLLILTGARCSEILTLKWNYIDWEKNLALLPDSKTGQKAIYLSAPALSILSKVPRTTDNPFVIKGQKAGRPMTDLKRPWILICKRADLDKLRIHDLRHSFASAAVGRGLSLPILGKLLGHASPQTTARYAHLADDPIMQANELVGRALAAALKKDPSPSLNTEKITFLPPDQRRITRSMK